MNRSFHTVDVALSEPVISRAWEVRIACPASGLATHTLRSRQSNRPTWGYLPLNFSVQNFVLTRGPAGAAGCAPGGAGACACARLPKRNILGSVLPGAVGPGAVGRTDYLHCPRP